MAFATINSNLSYWQKQESPLYPDLSWNIPEQRKGNVIVIGGNSQNFSTPIRITEFLENEFPFNTVKLLLPDALRGKIPILNSIELLPSTASGSFAASERLRIFAEKSDATLVIGDLSKNSSTAVAIAKAIRPHEDPKPLILARDSVDLLASDAEDWLTRQNTIIIASMAQLQKIFRAIYYPRMIMLSQPLIPVLETLHKFTLSYPITIVTFHQENIIVANSGNITTTHIADTNYSPISLWSGQLASKILGMNLFNPNKQLAASTATLLY